MDTPAPPPRPPPPTTPGAASAGRSRAWLALLLVLGVTAFVHRSALEHDFVNWDDDINLYANPNLVNDDIRYALPWREPYQGMYIPVTYTVWAALADSNRRAVAPGSYSLDPGPFHAASYLLHLGSTALLFFLLMRWLSDNAPRRRVLAAGCGALLFAIHPLQVEAVHWATAMKDTLSLFLALASLALLPVPGERPAWRMPAAWLVFALALAAKPSVVVVPALWLLVQGAREGRVRRAAWPHFGVLTALAVAAASVGRVAQPASSAGTAHGLLQRLWVSFDSLGFYLGKLVVPGEHCPDYGRTPQWVLEQGLFTLAVTTGVAYTVLVAWLAWRRHWKAACLLTIFPFALSPVLGLLPFNHQKFSTVTDRYAYLAMLGPAYLMARLVARGTLVTPVAAGFLAVCAWLALPAGAHWQDGHAMWTHVLEVNPRSGSAWTNLGFTHEAAGRGAEAIEHYERALDADPGNALAHNNIGNIDFRAGRLDAAAVHYRNALSANPRDLNGRNNLGVIHFEQGRLAEAEALYEQVIAINPKFSPAFHNLGRLALQRGDVTRAEECFAAALEIDPGFAKVHRSLATLLAHGGARDSESRGHLGLALGRAEGERAFELAWSELLIQVGRPEEHIRAARLAAWRRGYREPAFVVQLSRGLAQAGDPAAEELLRDALAQAPDALAPRLDLADLLQRSGRWHDYEQLLVQSVRHFPRASPLWQHLARYQLERNRLPQARALARSALGLAPDDPATRRLAAQLGVWADEL